TGGNWPLLWTDQRAAAALSKCAEGGDRSASDRRHRRERALLRAGLRDDHRIFYRVLGLEVLLQLLAPDHRDPACRHRRQRRDGGGSHLAAADRHPDASGVPLGAWVFHLGVRERDQGVL